MLLRTRQIGGVDDIRWNFWGILPLLVVAATIIVIFGYFLDAEPATPDSATAPTLPVPGSSDAGTSTGAGTEDLPRPSTSAAPTLDFYQRALAIFEGDESEPRAWMPAAVVLAIVQITAITSMFFWAMSTVIPNAASALAVSVAVPLFVGVPALSFIFVTFCVAYELRPEHAAGLSRRGVITCWLAMGAMALLSVFAYDMAPFIGWQGLAIAQLVLIGVGGLIALVNSVAVGFLLVNRRPGAISLGE